jgi:hypothetical protein
MDQEENPLLLCCLFDSSHLLDPSRLDELEFFCREDDGRGDCSHVLHSVHRPGDAHGDFRKGNTHPLCVEFNPEKSGVLRT